MWRLTGCCTSLAIAGNITAEVKHKGPLPSVAAPSTSHVCEESIACSPLAVPWALLSFRTWAGICLAWLLLTMQGAQVVGQKAKAAKQQNQATLQSQEPQVQQSQQQQGRRKLLK